MQDNKIQSFINDTNEKVKDLGYKITFQRYSSSLKGFKIKVNEVNTQNKK